jgi:hypothetical protein
MTIYVCQIAGNPVYTHCHSHPPFDAIQKRGCIQKHAYLFVFLSNKIIKEMVTIIKKGTTKDEIKKRINKVVFKNHKKDIKKYAGILKTNIDPLAYQKQIRDEWE